MKIYEINKFVSMHSSPQLFHYFYIFGHLGTSVVYYCLHVKPSLSLCPNIKCTVVQFLKSGTRLNPCLGNWPCMFL